MNSIKLSLAVSAAAFGVALAAAPAAAQDGAAPEKKTERIILLQRTGDHAEGGDHVRRFRVEALGDLAGRCSGTKDEIGESSSDGKERTHLILCGDGQTSAAQRAEKLEHMLSRVEADGQLSAEQKAKVTTALRDAIDRARAAQ